MDKILTIIPAYNKEEFLEGAIESVLQQTHQNQELVIIDDCSTDKTLEIAKSYEHLSNVTVLSNTENRGCYYTRNRGLEHFKDKEWDYFTIHDADDISSTNRFDVLLQYFKNPDLLGLKTTFRRVNRQLEQQLTGEGKINIHASEGIAFYRRKAFDYFGYFDNTRFSGDTDYWWRLEAFCHVNPKFKFGVSGEELYLAIEHESNLTLKYDFHTVRPKYWDKIRNDIRSKMIPNNNFYREIFK
jgi:glycosyltransferase involved in cell wall biosynthesis